MSEISTKPYLLRAIHEWCTDSGYTPYIAVSVDEHTLVPEEFVRAGEIVLNISMSATNRLSIGNELIEFQARFGGVGRELSIPIDNVSAIYARENGHGMAFEVPKEMALPEGDADGDGLEDEPLGLDQTAPDLAQADEIEAALPDDAAGEKPKTGKTRGSRKKSRPSLAAVPKSEPDETAPTDDGPDEDGGPSVSAKSSKPGASRKGRGKPTLTRVK